MTPRKPEHASVWCHGVFGALGLSNLHSTLLTQPSIRPTRPLSKNGPYKGDPQNKIPNSSRPPCVSPFGGWLPHDCGHGLRTRNLPPGAKYPIIPFPSRRLPKTHILLCTPVFQNDISNAFQPTIRQHTQIDP